MLVLNLPVALAGHVNRHKGTGLVFPAIAGCGGEAVFDGEVWSQSDHTLVGDRPGVLAGDEQIDQAALDPLPQCDGPKGGQAQQTDDQKLTRARQLLRHGGDGRGDLHCDFGLDHGVVAVVALSTAVPPMWVKHHDTGVEQRFLVVGEMVDYTALVGADNAVVRGAAIDQEAGRGVPAPEAGCRCGRDGLWGGRRRLPLRRRPGVGVEHRDEIGLVHRGQGDGALLGDGRCHETGQRAGLRDGLGQREHPGRVVEAGTAAAVESAERAIRMGEVLQEADRRAQELKQIPVGARAMHIGQVVGAEALITGICALVLAEPAFIGLMGEDAGEQVLRLLFR